MLILFQAAANCYIELIVKESDNNVKLIVLDRLIALKDNPLHEKILQDLAMDVLRILSTPDIEVRRKALNLGIDLLNLIIIEYYNFSVHSDGSCYHENCK